MQSRKPDVDSEALKTILRRAFATSSAPQFERTATGVSTQVYKVIHGAEVFYLRVAEEEGDNLATDALIHEHLRRLGVRVPEIVYVEEFEPSLKRSLRITREIPGRPVAEFESLDVPADVLREAGRDIAIVNQVTVEGFGWIRREGFVWPLRGELATYPEFVRSYLPERWPGRLAVTFDSSRLARLETLIESECEGGIDQARLVHGDFDSTHIFVNQGRYSGLIDFGEIRGADQYFDLGLFFLLRQHVRPNEFEELLAGYAEITPLGATHREDIRRSAILLGLRQLSRWLSPDRGLSPDQPPILGRSKRLAELLDGNDKESKQMFGARS